MICTTCHAKMVSPGRRWIPPLQGALLGTVAAVVGAGVYRMVLFRDRVEFLPGRHPRRLRGGRRREVGIGDRGGRFYQFLAVFLTYSARRHVPSQPLGVIEPEVDRTRRSPGEDREESSRRGEGRSQSEGRGRLPAGRADRKDRPEEPRRIRVRNLFYILGMLLFALLMMVGLVYSIPIIVGLHSPISLFIFAVGLWQAWKMSAAARRPSPALIASAHERASDAPVRRIRGTSR